MIAPDDGGRRASRRAAAGVLLIAAAQIALSAWWMHGNGFFDRPPFMDAGWFRVDAQLMVERARAEGISGWLAAPWDHARPHPPLLPWLAAGSALLTDGAVDQFDQWLAQQVFGVLIAIGSYRLARNFGGRRFALFAAAAMTSAPVLLVSSRGVMPKFAMTGCVLLALDSLVRSDGLRRTRAALLAGVWGGLALLTMMLAPLYLAGAGLVVAGVGLRGGGRRGVVVRNAGLGVVAALAVCGWWYARHYEQTLNYARTVTGAEGQAIYSAGMGPWSLDRWLYYPTQLVNNGLGACVAAAVVLLAVADAVGRSLRRRTPAAAVESVAPRGAAAALCATGLVAFVVVTRGQTAGESQYAMPLAPLLALYAASALRGLPTGAPRVAACAVYGAATLFHVGVALRDFEHDLTTVRTGRIQWVGQADYYLAESARRRGGVPRPEAERWPLIEFVERMAELSPDGKIRFGAAAHHHHPFVNGGNLWFTAIRKGVDFEARSLRGLPNPSDRQAADFVAFVDFMVVDALYHRGGFEAGETKRLLDVLKRGGAEIEVVATAKPTAVSELRLLRLLKRGASTTVEAESALEAPDVRRRDVAFEGGRRIVGERRSEDGALELFVRTDPGAVEGRELFVHAVVGDATAGEVRIPLSKPRAAAAQLYRVRAKFPAGIGTVDAYRVGIRIAGGKGRPEDHARIVASDAPREGRFLVRFAAAP